MCVFRVCGRKVEVLRYSVSYTDIEGPKTEHCATIQEAEEVSKQLNGALSLIPLGDDAWMDGIKVDDVPDTYGEAMRVYEMGEAAWKVRKTPEEQLRADVDFLSAMTGVMLV